MRPVEIEQVLQHMTVIVDSREQQTEQAERRYSAFGVPWVRGKLDFGDYSTCLALPDGSRIDFQREVVVERKMSLDELCACFTRERDRFAREFDRAKAAGARVYLLVEGASWELIYNGRYRSRLTPQALTASILAWCSRYDCRIMFCKAETSGRLIHDILYREAKERLTAAD